MKSFGLVCLMLLSTSLTGQSTATRRTEPRLRAPMMLPRVQQGTHLTTFGSAIRRTASTQAASLNFAPAVDYGSGGFDSFSVAVADINGDGKLDLAVSNFCDNSSDCTNGIGNGTVGVLLGKGDGTFQSAVVYDAGGSDTYSVAMGDVNGDGKPDLIVTNECIPANCYANDDGSVGVLVGNGDGTFQPVVTYDSGGTQPDSVVVADVNQDGKPDLVVANACAFLTFCETNGSVSILLGNGDGTFQAAVASDLIDRNTVSVVVADVNGDGKPDLVVANALANHLGVQSSVSVLLGNGDGTFQGAVTYRSGGFGADSIAVADVNRDGKPDIVVANSCTNTQFCGNSVGSAGILLGNGDGTFKAAVNYGSGGYNARSVAVADLNGDGNADLTVANYCGSSDCSSGGTVGVLLGNGDGTFQMATAYSSGAFGSSFIVFADTNKDGKPDLLVANACAASVCTNGAAGVLINTSVGTTATSLISSLNPSTFGQTVTFTATVTSQGFLGTPTGTVTFLDGTTILGSSSLNSSGVAIFSISSLAVGTHSITATYNGDSNFTSSTSPVLSQVVQGAIAQLSPASLTFGNQTVGIVSSPQTVTLMNTGNVALTITSISITGTNKGDFAQTNNCGTSVSAGGSCVITVTFTPVAVGTRNAAVSITDNAPGSPQTASVTGVGVKPAVTLSPTSLTFSTQVVFTTSKAKTVTLTNSGAGLLTISKIAASSQFSETNTCGTSVAAGASCTISVTFKPTAINTISGSVSITDNASGSPQKVNLTGTGTYVQLTPSSLNFGNQPVGTKSLGKKITLSNKGSVSVSITSISITGTNGSDFGLTTTCGSSVAAGASCFITVTFTPSAKGSRSASVSVSDNGGGSPQKVNLAGTGT